MTREIGALQLPGIAVADYGRVARMGDCGVCRGCGQRKEKQGSDHAGPHSLGTSRNGRMHALAEDFVSEVPVEFVPAKQPFW